MVSSTEHRKHDDGSNSGVTVIHLDFDDLGVVDPSDDSLEVDIDLPARPMVRRPIDDPRARQALSDTPLFSQVAPPILERLIARMSLVELAPQEILFREGEPGNALYVVSDGEVAVESGAAELARLGPSQFFGEIAIVTDLPRSATIRALVRTELLLIDRDVVREAAEEYPELIPVMLRFVRERLVDRVTRTSELFRQFNESERADLVSGFELLEIAANVTLVNEGRRADGLYVVMAGSLEVRRASAAEPVATLGPGDVFGELSLLANHGAMASVTCLTRVIALRLPQSRFQALIMTHGRLLAYLGDLAAKRSVTVDDVVDFHLDLL
jgi:CRP-like cAMP-binding protein